MKRQTTRGNILRVVFVILVMLIMVNGCGYGKENAPAAADADVAVEKEIQESSVSNDWICIPFQRAGPITPETNEAELIRFFGRENVRKQTIYGVEGTGPYEVSVIFADTPNQLVVFWRQNRYGSGVSSVSIRRQQTAWKTVHGITIGTSLAELNRINGRPFKFFGFGWDYGGSVPLNNEGVLTSTKGLYLVLISTENLPREYYGEGKLDSGDPRLLPEVVRVGRINIDLSKNQ